MPKVFLAAVGWFTVGALIATTLIVVAVVITVQTLLALTR